MSGKPFNSAVSKNFLKTKSSTLSLPDDVKTMLKIDTRN